MDKQTEFVLRAIEERDVRFVRMWFTDVLGFLKSVAVAPAELEGAFAEGMGFDGSAIEGFARVYESDMLAHPDPSTFQVLPWRDISPATARMFCDITMPDGSPSYADPRYVLKRALKKAADLGFTFYTHPEVEFFLFKDPIEPGKPPTPVDQSGYFDHTPQSLGTDFRRRAITMLEQMGISVEYSHHEGAPGQQEIDLRYADALSTADNLMTFRVVVKEVALSQGIHASFMPKPFTEHPGSGMHTHMSLFEGDTNAFYDASAEHHLSKIGRYFIAGLLRTPPRSPRSPTSGPTPTSGWPAAVRRPATSAGVATTARRLSGYRCTSRTRALRPGVELRSIDSAANPTWPLRSFWRRAWPESRVSTSCPKAPRTMCGLLRSGNGRRWGSHRCHAISTRPSASWSGPSWSLRRSESMSLTSSCGTSVRSSRNTADR